MKDWLIKVWEESMNYMVIGLVMGGFTGIILLLDYLRKG